MFLDLSFGKILFLAVIAIVVFGPDQLPKMAQQAGRTLRELRRLADGATRDIREGLGPEFEEFDLRDLHPGNFVRKHLFEDDMDGSAAAAAAAAADPVEYAADRRATATLPVRNSPRRSTPRPPDRTPAAPAILTRPVPPAGCRARPGSARAAAQPAHGTGSAAHWQSRTAAARPPTRGR